MRSPLANLSFYFSVFMLVIYLLLAYVLIVYQWPADLPKGNRTILACALVLYAVYRGYKLVQKRKDQETNDTK